MFKLIKTIIIFFFDVSNTYNVRIYMDMDIKYNEYCKEKKGAILLLVEMYISVRYSDREKMLHPRPKHSLFSSVNPNVSSVNGVFFLS